MSGRALRPFLLGFALLASVAILVRLARAPAPGARSTGRRPPAADISLAAPVPLLLDSAFADAVERSAAIAAIAAILEVRLRNTYLGELLAARGSVNHRWPDRRGVRMRVWVQDIDATRPELARRIVAEAFEDWAGSGIPIAFTIVPDSSRAEVIVTWVEQFDAVMTGLTRWATDPRDWIVSARIELARRQPDGIPLSDASLAAIARHETGHLLGLDHTGDSTSIMAARVRVTELSEADRRTIRLVYDLPAGPLPVPKR